MRKIKYVCSNNGVFVSDRYKKSISEQVTFSCLVALDNNLVLLKPYIKMNSIFLDINTPITSETLRDRNDLYYNIKELTYLVDCRVTKKGDTIVSKPLIINILQMVDEELILYDVTTKLPYELREILQKRCIEYLKLRMI